MSVAVQKAAGAVGQVRKSTLRPPVSKERRGREECTTMSLMHTDRLCKEQLTHRQILLPMGMLDWLTLID